MRLRIDNVLFVVPLLGAHHFAIHILEIRSALGSEEVCNGVAIFLLVDFTRGENAVKTRLEAFAGKETQRVTDIYDCMARPRFNPEPRFAFLDGTEELQTPLRGKKKCERADIGVLVVAGITVVKILRIVKQDESRCGRPVRAMIVFESSGTTKVQRIRKTHQDGLGNKMGGGDKVMEQGKIVPDSGERHR